MQRRDFLHAASLAVASSTIPAGVAFAASIGAASDPRLQLLRAEAGVAGAPFLPPVALRADSAARSTVHIDRLHAVDGAPVIARFELRAIFAQADGSEATFLAWNYGAAPGASRSDRVRFVTQGNALRRFEVGYQLTSETLACNEKCSVSGVEAGALQPGQYVLLGPRRNGLPVDAWRLVGTGDASEPLRLRTRDFDYLAFRVEATT
jgi:hypothetical protein